MEPVLSDVYYSPRVLGKSHYSKRDLALDAPFESRQSANNELFKSAFTSLFKQSRKASEDYDWDIDTIIKGKRLLESLYKNYVDRITLIYDKDGLSIRKIGWLCNTHNCICEVCSSVPSLFIDVPVGDKMVTIQLSYSPFRNELLLLIYHMFFERGLSLKVLPVPNTSLSILYNMWGSDFDKAFNDLNSRSFGLIDDMDIAKVDSSANRKMAKKLLHEDWDYYSDNNNKGEIYIIDGEYDKIYDFNIRKYYYDYLQRVSEISDEVLSSEKKGRLLIQWCLSTLQLAMGVYDETNNKDCDRPNCPQSPFVLEEATDLLFLCCICPLMDIMTLLFTKNSNAEATEVVKEEDCPGIDDKVIPFQGKWSNEVTPEQARVILDTIDEVAHVYNRAKDKANVVKPGREVFVYFGALLHFKILLDLDPRDLWIIYPSLYKDGNLSNYLGKKGNHGEGGSLRNLSGAGHSETIKEFSICIKALNQALKDKGLDKLDNSGN